MKNLLKYELIFTFGLIAGASLVLILSFAIPAKRTHIGNSSGIDENMGHELTDTAYCIDDFQKTDTDEDLITEDEESKIPAGTCLIRAGEIPAPANKPVMPASEPAQIIDGTAAVDTLAAAQPGQKQIVTNDEIMDYYMKNTDYFRK